MNNLDARIADLPLSVIDLMLDIDEFNTYLKTLRTAELFPAEDRQAILADASALLQIHGAHNKHQDVNDTDIMVKRQEWEAHAYCEVLEFTFENYHEIEISEESIMSLHKELYHYAPEDVWHKGIYKNGENKVETKDNNGKTLRVLVEGTPHKDAPDALRKLVSWYNDAPTAIKYPPLLRISAFLAEFLKIHPFVDGNGRVSRALTDLLLLKTGYIAELYYPHEKIIEEDTEAYYQALSRAQKTFGTKQESMRTWTLYFLETILAQNERAVALSAPRKKKRHHAKRHQNAPSSSGS